ncbi:DUF6527 family protein [Flavobacterium sp.]|uniref:DUF6527 family protein n=1 Tax=Flavobacterium sp. TaxID=239 RepID=UPI0039E67DA5
MEFIPSELEEGVLYITVAYKTAVHLCICGCGNRVVTPITPTDWQFTFNGRTITLYPSIGNWNFECRSHYWIQENDIVMAPKWSQEQIERGRRNDAEEKEWFFGKKKKKKK